MVRERDGRLAFNYTEYKKGFRAACQARGIDPERGATDADIARNKESSFQKVLREAETRRATHEQAAFDAHMRKHLFQFVTDGQRATRRDAKWWMTLEPDDWKPGTDSSSVERQALANIRREIARHEGQKLVTAREVREDVAQIVREAWAEVKAKTAEKSQKDAEMSLYNEELA